MGICDFTVRAMDGTSVPLSDCRGKVLLIVNSATGCGFTPQYDELRICTTPVTTRVWSSRTSPATSSAGSPPAPARRSTPLQDRAYPISLDIKVNTWPASCGDRLVRAVRATFPGQ